MVDDEKMIENGNTPFDSDELRKYMKDINFGDITKTLGEVMKDPGMFNEIMDSVKSGLDKEKLEDLSKSMGMIGNDSDDDSDDDSGDLSSRITTLESDVLNLKKKQQEQDKLLIALVSKLRGGK